jgi:ATP/maltotriose-dependent transcriptional regulator MalT
METPLVGRAAEREAIATAIAAFRARPGGVLAVEGEPGIGKSRLLAHLAAEAEGSTVLHARASEFEFDLPHALWTEALGGHLAALGERRVARLGLADPEALPVLGDVPAPDRHRIHRALRELLERLGATAPLVLCLDDVHWADPASVDALAALIRRPPGGPVLLTWASREGQVPAPLVAATAAALREERATALALAPLSESEAAELVGAAAASIYPQAGGNPFYLEQLARVAGGAHAAAMPDDGSVPPAVAAALASELGELSPEARQLLDAAAVAGDPFDADLAAEIAELSEPAALDALDELLARALTRPDATPRRFAFRHPVVRHAVYEAIPGGRRLGAHGRAAAALERRGAGAVQRAHHVEHAARAGDADAIALLTTAAEELHSPAPATAARFYAAALRLAPESAPAPTRMRSRLADALAAAGDPEGARQTLLDALETAAPGDRLALIVSLANQEWWLGGHVDARRRLHVALGELPAQPSPDRIRLRLALALTALLACDLPEAQAHASDASDDARAIGDPVFEVAGLAAGALARASDAAGDRIAESAAALDRLTDAQVATRLPALWMHGRARRALGRFDEALADLERAAAIATRTGRERVLLVVTVESVATLIELGRLADAAAAAEDGVELARLAGNPRMLLWAHSALSRARLAMGDVDGALRHAQEAADAGMEADFHAAGQPDWCLGAALTAAGNPERAVEALLDGLGGEDLERVLSADRPGAAADLVEARLACEDVAGAERALARGEEAAAQADTPWAAAVAGMARASVLLAAGSADRALIAAATARESAAPPAPLLAARAQLLEGRALAATGRRPEAIEVLIAAEAELDRFGAARLRGEAARELRQLGHRVIRPARDAEAGPLTAREREIADLVAAGRTNREIAAQLVLSTRTIEAHLRNIFAKLGVRSRVELAREAAGQSAAVGADGSGS